MTHEFKDILKAYVSARKNGLRSVLATVVALDGSSYRKPGVRMIILENEEIIGAVSGGCVEKDIVRQSKTVFANGKSKMMTYDGRFRLGCEGILYILLEELILDDQFISEFKKCIEVRDHFKLVSSYVR
jgi:xanthine/CO dehydrogenase XdhC/CoxF family maturation factor